MTSIRKTPRRQPDSRLSNLVLEGGKSKRYVTRDAQGRFIVERDKDLESTPSGHESIPPNGEHKD
jgi:hypothetical protein